jgi:hypothetical protein
LRWINFGVRDGSITSLQREFLEDRIKGPEFLGIDQRDIDDYYDYIEDYHNGTVYLINQFPMQLSLRLSGTKTIMGC